MTLATLNKAIRNSRQTGLEFAHEAKPNEMTNEGSIEIVIDHDLKLQFSSNGCTSCVAIYWSDCKNSRSDAIDSLIDDIEFGFEPMSEETAYSCGIEL